jgi:S1-C subfamily serine protease
MWHLASSLSILLFALSLSAKPVAGGDINACKYLVVTDFSVDPYGIAKELRAQATERGFAVVPAAADVPEADSLKVCVMVGSWSRDAFGGEVSVRVMDAGGELLGEGASNGSSWGVARTVRKLVSKIYEQLGYSGYNESVYEERFWRKYPPRPKFAVTEDKIKGSELKNRVQGIWTDTQNKYRLGIVPAPEGSGEDYLAVVLASSSPIWQIGEIKGEIRTTATTDVYTCTFYMANKKPAGATLFLEHDSLLRGSFSTPQGSIDLVLVRVWPGVSGESARESPASSGASGTGFLLSRSGLIATNWHVVANAKNIAVAFPGWTDRISAEIAIRDTVNDLAVVRITDSSRIAATCPQLPFQLSSSRGVTLGQRVSTIGYPLTSLLGSSPKFSEGVVASQNGLDDDPRTFQISAQVQPGSSGSPLFDSEGNIVGVVVATLDASKLYQMAGVLPQNVNWAIKSDYLLTLISALGQAPASRETAFSPDKAAQCVAIVSAW